MKKDEFRHRLIDGTFHVIAQYGLDKATTKQIGAYTGVNEAYIYRCFKDKEDMLTQMFDQLDEELFSVSMQHVEIMYAQNMEFEARCRGYFFAVWDILMEDRDELLAYVQYFYSPYFVRYSAKKHERRFKPLTKRFKDAFIDEADVWMILNHILNIMLDFAVKVHNGQMPGSDEYVEHVFRVIYESVRQYFKKDERGDTNA